MGEIDEQDDENNMNMKNRLWQSLCVPTYFLEGINITVCVQLR